MNLLFMKDFSFKKQDRQVSLTKIHIIKNGNNMKNCSVTLRSDKKVTLSHLLQKINRKMNFKTNDIKKLILFNKEGGSETV